MQTCLDKVTRAPLNYFNQIRQLTKEQLTMKDTSFYPSFLLAICASLICILSLSGYLLFYFFTSESNACYDNIGVGIKGLAIIYPIQSILIFVCVSGSAVLSKSNVWKIGIIMLFGFIVSGFPFGGIGFAFLCTIEEVNPLLIKTTFLSSNSFIQVVVYFYLCFFILYLVMIPAISYAFNKRKENPDPQAQAMDKFCCALYYFFQTLFVFATLFIILIKLLGIPLLIYALVEMSRSNMNSSAGSLAPFFALTILSLCLPFVTFIVAFVIKNHGKKEDDNEDVGAFIAERQSGRIQLTKQQKQVEGNKQTSSSTEKSKALSNENSLQDHLI